MALTYGTCRKRSEHSEPLGLGHAQYAGGQHHVRCFSLFKVKINPWAECDRLTQVSSMLSSVVTTGKRGRGQQRVMRGQNEGQGVWEGRLK